MVPVGVVLPGVVLPGVVLVSGAPVIVAGD
jgi:hypothetical protein